MEEQSKFLELLGEIQRIAHAQNQSMTKEEISTYLADEHLSDVQMQAVYQYLGEHHIKVQGYDYVPTKMEMEPEEKVEEKDKPKQKKTTNQSKVSSKKNRSEQNHSLYISELSKLPEGLPSEEKICAYLEGNTSIRNEIVEGFLKHVVVIAKRYKERQVGQDELIAEGNLALMQTIAEIEEVSDSYILIDGSIDQKRFFTTIETNIIHTMEQYIDEQTESKDQEQAMLAKTNLLNEAAKYLTEEIGRVPTIEELSQYTKIDREEIGRLRGLSEDAKRVADSEGEK